MLCFGLLYEFTMCCYDEVSDSLRIETRGSVLDLLRHGEDMTPARTLLDRRRWPDESGMTVGSGCLSSGTDPQNVTDHIPRNSCITYIDCRATSPFRSACVIFCRPMLMLMHTPSLSDTSAAFIGTVFGLWVISGLM
jgi:hypothetical protein